ncbi:MAG: PAS domain S-box protein [Candidatus Lokiarchaeota archaeon]|nr:PAS domain S-box protein [Candidatus Lokiarchaeota archaeon]
MISDKKNKYVNFEKIFPFFLETIEDLIIIVSLDNSFKIEYIHESKFLEQLGYSDGILLGKSLLNLVDFGVKSPKRELLGIIQQNNNRKDVKVIKKNGKLTWVEFIPMVFNDEKDQQKLIVRLRDISKRKELEIKLEKLEKHLEKISKIVPEIRFWKMFTPKKYDQALKKSEALLKTAIECLPFDIFMINKDGYYDMQNSTFQEHWGDVIGKRPEEVANDQETRIIWKDNNSRAFSGETVMGELRFKINGNYRHFYNIINPVYINGEIQNIIGVNIDITELKSTEQKLKESEDKFRTIAEQSFMGICIIQDFEIKYLNQQMAEIYGYQIDEISQWKPKEFVKVIHSDSKEMVMNQIIKKQQGSEDTIRHYIAKIIKKNGKIRYVENYSKTINFQGKPADLLTQIDITAKVNAEQKLKESELKFRKILEAIPDTFFLLSADSTVLECKNYDPKTEIYYKSEYLGKKVHEFLPVDIAKIVAENISKTIDTQEPQIAEFMAHINNDFFTAEGRFLYLSQDRVGLFLRTITEKKKLEIKLRKSEEKYRHLFQNSPYFIGLVDQNGVLIDCNNEVNNILSMHTKDNLIGKGFSEILSLNKKNKYIIPIFEEYFTSILKGEQKDSIEFKLYRSIGEFVWLNLRGSLIKRQEKNLVQFIIVNITKEKKSEEKLRESEEKFRRISEQSLVGICIIQDNLIKYINQQFAQYSGYNVDEIMNWEPGEYIKLIHPEDRKKVLEQSTKKQKGFSKVINQYEFRVVNKTGEMSWVENISNTITFDGKNAVLISLIDITEKKEAEQKLKESEAKYHELFETSPDGVILTDLKGNIIECNSALEHISGYSPTEFIGKNFMKLDIYYENGLEILLEGYRDLLKENRLKAVEFPIKCKDNQINWVQVRYTLINMKGQTYILAVIHDVTTQKEAENAIKRSEERYRDILETSSVGVIELDVIKNQIKYMNPKLVEIIQYRGDELTEAHFINKLIHPKDLHKLLNSNEESELEFRIFDKLGKLKWLSGKRIPHYDDNGQITSIRVWLEDITEKKMYENLIYELNVNFLNFTTDIKNNIQLLLNTCLNLLNGDFILYINETEHKGKDSYQILTSDNKSFICDSKFFVEELFVSALFYESHDFPQTFFNINRMSFANTDPFIARYNLKGCFGKLIKSQNDSESAVCVFYKQNPAISNQDKLVMFLICDAIEIEQRRWQVQRGLEEQNITLNKINNLKTELFSRTSHELKTPLISIKGFTELLLTLHKHKLDKDILSILEEIKEGSKRLEKIINLLLESTKLETGHLELSLSKEDLSFLINFCVNELKGLAKLRNQSITLKLHDTLETHFDKERIYEVISNLLLNAIKYTPPGGSITIKSTIKDDYYLTSVKDNGIGFTAEEKNQVFQQFGKIERYGQGWDVAIEGTGLGLYITKKLVELHGGKIWLESEGRNKGSTFYFTIPIKN